MKVSKVQMAVLKMIAEGSRITNTPNGYSIRNKAIASATFYILSGNGMIESAGKWSEGYTITPAGRAIVQAADTAGQGAKE